MRIRKVDANGDYLWGHGASDFWINSPDGVGLLVVYRLNMPLGAWWLDTSQGVPYQTQIIGFGTSSSRDPAIRAAILGTQGVTAIASYSSALVRGTRAWSVNASLNTAYSVAPQPISTAIVGS